jgi:hypothetical protein
MTITEFLEARIAEDEAAARAATPSPWTLYDRGVGWEIPELPEVHDGLTFSKSDAHYVARNQPGRALAECAAKRAIIKQAEEATSDRYYVIGNACVTSAEIAEAEATDPGELILRALAAVYASHPDYDEEWAL